MASENGKTAEQGRCCKRAITITPKLCVVLRIADCTHYDESLHIAYNGLTMTYLGSAEVAEGYVGAARSIDCSTTSGGIGNRRHLATTERTRHYQL